MAAVFFLCAVQNQQNRITGEDGKRLRCEFPKRPWFLKLVQQHHLEQWLQTRAREYFVTTKYVLVGLMKCVSGIAADDVLSSYDADARAELDVWRQYWTSMGNLYTVLVEECFIFHQPQDVHTYVDSQYEEPRPLVGRRYPLSPFVPPRCPLPEILQLTGDLCKAGQRLAANVSVGHALGVWGLTMTGMTPAIPVAEPVASLICKGSWRSIGLLGHWALPSELFDDASFPPDDLREIRFVQTEHWSAAISQEKLSSLIARVQSWAPALLQNDSLDADEASTIRLEISDTLQWLNQLRQGTQGQARPRQYPAHVMIATVFLAFLLGSRKHVGEAVPLALQVALPGLDLQELVRELQMPRTATISRASTYLDFAYLMICREDWKQQPPVLYVWADSSPQSGREWFMSMSACCSRESLTVTFDAVNKLSRSRPDVADHWEAEELDFEEFLRLNGVLKQNLFHHKHIPVAMGSGKTRLEDKASCLLHATAFECEGRPGLEQQLQRMVSWTTDLGTEVQLPQLQTSSMQTLLPTWLHAQVLAASDVEEIQSDAEGARPRIELPLPAQDAEEIGSLMPSCLIVPGCLHIFHNLSSDLHEKLRWWSAFWDQLQDVAALLAERFLRERFVHQCLRGSASAQYEEDFKATGISKLYEKRWQNVISCLDHLLPLFEPLRQAWDYNQFIGDSGIDPKVALGVDKALSSPLFCRYVFMVYGVHKLMANFEFWLESCPCHQQLGDEEEPSKKRRHRKRKSSAMMSLKQCPMKGKRSSEMAAGAVDTVVDSLCNLSFQTYVQSDDAALPEEDRAIILRDFEFARSFLDFGIKAKLAFWKTVPWKLCGLGHHWVSAARQCAKESLQEFDDSLAGGQVKLEHHHPLARKFLSPSGPLRVSVEGFAGGAVMSQQLHQAVSELKFIPCVERVVEGTHRDVRIAAKHVQLGPTKVSLTLRLPEIKTRVQDHPGFLSRLTQSFDEMRSLKRAAAALGVIQHPDLLHLMLQNNVDTASWWISLQFIVHRCNLTEQFSNLSDVRQQHDKKRKHDKAEATRAHNVLALPTPRTYEKIFKRCICDHFRKLADSESFFSLPCPDNLQDGRYQLVSFEPGRSVAAPPVRDEGADVEELPSEARSSQLVFRVLHGAPENLKLVPGPIAMKPLFVKGASVVTLHETVHEGVSGPAVNISAAATPQLLQDLECCPLQVLRQDLQVWKLSPDVSYTLPCRGFPSAEVTACVTALLDAKGVPDEPYVSPPAQAEEICQELERRHYVQSARQASGAMLVRLTLSGMSNLRAVTALIEPKAVCRRTSKQLSECDAMELLLALESDGWTWKPLPSAKKKRQELSYKPGDDKVFYSQSHVINKAYLQCLLTAEKIVIGGAIDSIPHWVSEPGKVYPALLKGEQYVHAAPPALAALAGGDDVEVGPLEDRGGGGEAHAIDQALRVLGSPGESNDAGSDDAESLSSRQLLEELEQCLEEEISPVANDDGAGAASPGVGPVDAADVVEPAAGDLPAEASAGASAPAPKRAARAAAAQAAGEESSVESELEKPSAWGCFRITPKQPSKSRKHGGFEARCPFHRRNDVTECKKYIALKGNSVQDKDRALRALKSWCNSAKDYNRQRAHVHHFICAETAPSDEILQAGVIADAPAVRPRTDVELDEEAARPADPGHGAGSSRGRGRGHGQVVSAKSKAKVKAKPKPVGKSAARARGRGRVAHGGRARRAGGEFSKPEVKTLASMPGSSARPVLC